MINVTIKNLSIGIIVLAMLYYSDSGHCSTDAIKYGVWVLSGIILVGYSIHYLYTSIRDRIIKENKAIIEQSKMIQELNTKQMEFVEDQQDKAFSSTKGEYDISNTKSTMPRKTKS